MWIRLLAMKIRIELTRMGSHSSGNALMSFSPYVPDRTGGLYSFMLAP